MSESLESRLGNPDEIFTQQEVYEAVRVLAPKMGYTLEPGAPKPQEIPAKTITMTIDGHERLGSLVVRIATTYDAMLTIPNAIDRILGDNFNPSRNTQGNAYAIAQAQEVIVYPVGFVDKLLKSENPDDVVALYAFNKQYNEMLSQRQQDATEKKSGTDETEAGNESVGSSETISNSHFLTPAGSE